MKMDTVFPQHFCNPCHIKINRARNARKDEVHFYPIAATESPHDVKDCRVRKKIKRLKNYNNKNNKQNELLDCKIGNIG